MKVVLAVSGGVDSSTLLACLLDKNHEVFGVIFKYGSKHNKYENEAAINICKHYEINKVMFDLSDQFSNFKSNLLLGQGEIPQGHYQDSNMSKTVVPGRNTIFASYMLGLAQSIEFDHVALGVHSGDHHIYPDCRLRYIESLNKTFSEASENKVILIAPFIDINKAEIIKIGSNLHVPYELTRTCYKDQELSCGKCGSCNERLEAFKLNSLIDPIEYEKI